MISDFNQLEKLFIEIDQQLTNDVPLYVIGGAVLLYQGLKPATKDIDVILSDEKTYADFVSSLTSLQFQRVDPTGVYKKMDVSAIFEREDYRIDAFLKTVCKRISLTNGMKQRAKPLKQLSHLHVFLCANEDIFIFKSMTEREGDLEDCIALVQRGLEWNSVLNELKAQIKHSGEDVWITWIGERLDILQDRGINIPIMNEVNKVRDEYFKQLEHKFLGKKSHQNN